MGSEMGSPAGSRFFVFIKFNNRGGLLYLPAVVNPLTMAGTGNRCG